MRGDVVFCQHCTFTWRIDESSTGSAASYHEVAAACRGFLDVLDHDPQIAAYAASRPDWGELRKLLREQCGSWSYYRQVHATLAELAKRPVRERMPALVEFKQRVARALK